MMTLFSILKRTSWLAQCFLFLFGTGVAVMLGCTVIGFPDFLKQWFLSEINKGEFFVQAQAVHLDWRGGVKAGHVRIYRKGIPGPPFVEMRECRLSYHLFQSPQAGRTRLKEIVAKDGILRPLWNTHALGADRQRELHGEMSSGANASFPFREVDLDIALSNFDVLGVWVNCANTSLHVDASGIHLSRLSGNLGRELHAGAIEGTLVWGKNGRISGRVATSFDPHALLPAMKTFYPGAVGILDYCSFPTVPPRADVTFEIETEPMLLFRAKGRLQASNYAYRGAVIGYASMSGEYSFGGGTNRLRIDPFSLTIRGRHARGHMDVDLNRAVSAFEIDSDVNLASLLRLAGMKESFMKDWDFDEGTRVVARGWVVHSGSRDSEIDAVVEGARISYRSMAFSNYQFNYTGRGMTHAFSHVRGNIGGGSISGSAVIAPGDSSRTMVGEVNAEIINVDSGEILKLATTNLSWRSTGKLFGTLHFDGIGANLAGQGQLTLRSARLFQSPFGVGLLREWGLYSQGLELADLPVEARFSFDLKGDRIASRDVQIEVGNLALTAQGGCGLDGSLDWIIKPTPVPANGVVRAVMAALKPIRLGEFSLTGTIKDPQWRSLSRINKN